jgi:hypothetical protein
VGLTQSFVGLVEPGDRSAFAAAPGSVRRAYYEAASEIVLDECRKQWSRGIGSNGRAMRVRKRAVLPDGADGPVMEPHHDSSRLVTLSDYAATDHGLTLFWYAGTGHRRHCRAGRRAARPRRSGRSSSTTPTARSGMRRSGTSGSARRGSRTSGRG